MSDDLSSDRPANDSLDLSLKVGPGTEVTLHFAIKLEDGAVVDSTYEQGPATFVVGDRNLLEGFEKLLFGLAAGDKESFTVLPEQGFGERNPSNIQQLPRHLFSEVEPAEGLLVSFADANAQELPGIIQSVTDEEVVVDFNHPLAGRNLLFDVEILAIRPAVTH